MSSQEFIEFVEDHTDYVPRSYSGRGMYGKRCVSITSNNPGDVILDILQVQAEIEPEAVSGMIGLLRGSVQDSMGRSAVIYWPDIEWPEGREERDEDE